MLWFSSIIWRTVPLNLSAALYKHYENCGLYVDNVVSSFSSKVDVLYYYRVHVTWWRPAASTIGVGFIMGTGSRLCVICCTFHQQTWQTDKHSILQQTLKIYDPLIILAPGTRANLFLTISDTSATMQNIVEIDLFLIYVYLTRRISYYI